MKLLFQQKRNNIKIVLIFFIVIIFSLNGCLKTEESEPKPEKSTNSDLANFPFTIEVPDESSQTGRWDLYEKNGTARALLAHPEGHPYVEGASVDFEVAEYPHDPNDVDAVLSWWKSRKPYAFENPYDSFVSQEQVEIAGRVAIRIRYHGGPDSVRPGDVREVTVFVLDGFAVLAVSWWFSPNEQQMLLQEGQVHDIVPSIRIPDVLP